MNKIYVLVTVSLILLQPCTGWGKDFPAVSYEQIRKAATVVGSGLYVDRNSVSLINPDEYAFYSYKKNLGNYFIFAQGKFVEGLIIRTRNTVDIAINTKEYKYGLYPVFSFDNYILASVCDYGSITSGKYVLLSVGEDTIEEEWILDSSAIDEKRVIFPPNYLVADQYIDFSLYERMRGNIVYYFSGKWSSSGKKSYVFEITKSGIECISATDSPLDIKIAKLEGHREVILMDKQLYIHDMGSGESEYLGKLAYERGGGPITDMILYETASKDRYFVDSKTLVSYPVPDSIANAWGYDDGFYGLDRDISHDPGFNEEGYYFSADGRRDTHFYVTEAGGGSVSKILTLEGFPIIEKVISADGKLYISGWQIGVVYNMKSKEVEEVYTSSTRYEKGNLMKVVFLQPFAGKTYVYLREPYNFPGHD